MGDAAAFLDIPRGEPPPRLISMDGDGGAWPGSPFLRVDINALYNGPSKPTAQTGNSFRLLRRRDRGQGSHLQGSTANKPRPPPPTTPHTASLSRGGGNGHQKNTNNK